jgi:hypothetical protein
VLNCFAASLGGANAPSRAVFGALAEHIPQSINPLIPKGPCRIKKNAAYPDQAGQPFNSNHLPMGQTWARSGPPRARPGPNVGQTGPDAGQPGPSIRAIFCSIRFPRLPNIPPSEIYFPKSALKSAFAIEPQQHPSERSSERPPNDPRPSSGRTADAHPPAHFRTMHTNQSPSHPRHPRNPWSTTRPGVFLFFAYFVSFAVKTAQKVRPFRKFHSQPRAIPHFLHPTSKNPRHSAFSPARNFIPPLIRSHRRFRSLRLSCLPCIPSIPRSTIARRLPRRAPSPARHGQSY